MTYTRHVIELVSLKSELSKYKDINKLTIDEFTKITDAWLTQNEIFFKIRLPEYYSIKTRLFLQSRLKVVPHIVWSPDQWRCFTHFQARYKYIG